MRFALYRLALTNAVVVVAVAVAAAGLVASPLAAQLVSPRSIPSVYAITNARVVPVSGPAMDKATIVIRDGLISAVGANVAVPGDARVIDAAGLTVYPGFIDPYGSLGIADGGGRGGRGGGRGAAAPAAPEAATGTSAHPAGLQPEVSATDLVHVDEAAFAGAQSAGITTALTAQPNGIFRGTSALINLSDDSLAHIVVKAAVTSNIGFRPAGRGGYPGSLLGVFAAMRQLFLDAQHYGLEQTAYAKNPRGMQRPEYDASLEALQPVLSGQIPVIMDASSEREIIRALDMAKEFKLKVIIAGAQEAPSVADRLKAEGVPVLLSLNYPRRAVTAADADPEPLRVLRERVEAPKVAAKLAQAGVQFAFTSDGVPWTDFLTNVQRSVDNGLAPDAALKAMTSQAADILGVGDRLGTIEVGKIANLAIARGDIFDRAGRVTQLFVDGKPVTPRPVAAGNAALNASGSFNTTVQVGGGDQQMTLTLQQNGQVLGGTYQGALGSGDVSNGSIDVDGIFHFTASLQVGGLTEEATFSGSLIGNAIAGTVTMVGEPLAPGKFVGTRPEGGAGGRGGRNGRGGPPPER